MCKDTSANSLLGQWSNKSQLSLEHFTYDQLEEDENIYEKFAVAWVLINGDLSPQLYEILAQLEERHIPTLLTQLCPDSNTHLQYQDTMAICPNNAEPSTTTAMLRALISQSEIIRSLQTEVRILRLRDAGLSGQIGRIDEELRLAAQLQREYLPNELPSIGPVDFHVLFRPASYVSGDIYDVVRLDSDHLGFFLADAVGHGVPAALMTMYIKRCLTTKRIDPSLPNGYEIIPPNESLAKLNHDMVQQQQSRAVRFATAGCGIINCKTLELTFARAGHPFPMILRNDGETELLDPDGGLLGVFPEETFELRTVQLNHGDRLLLYSDGFEVAFPDLETRDENGKRPDEPQYTKQLEDLGVGPIDEAFARLEDKIDNQSGSLNQRDDLTALILNINMPADEQGLSDAA